MIIAVFSRIGSSQGWGEGALGASFHFYSLLDQYAENYNEILS